MRGKGVEESSSKSPRFQSKGLVREVGRDGRGDGGVLEKKKFDVGKERSDTRRRPK